MSTTRCRSITNREPTLPAIEASIVEVCIFCFTDSAPMYLLLRRSSDDKIYPGMWQIVSGSVEKGETSVHGSLRELKEETGFTPQRYWVVPHMNTFLDPRRDVVHVSSVFLAQVAPGAVPVLSREHDRFEWCTYEKARRNLVWPGQVRALEVIHDYIVEGKEAARLAEIPLDSL